MQIFNVEGLSVLWHQPQLAAEAEAIVEQMPGFIERDLHFDIISGAAGCIGSLLALYWCAPSDRTMAAAVLCGEHLLAHAQHMPRGLGWVSEGVASKPLTGFSHGGAGIAWALLELAAASRDGRFRTAALGSIDYERSLFDPAEENWPDLRESEASDANAGKKNFAMAWCHARQGSVWAACFLSVTSRIPNSGLKSTLPSRRRWREVSAAVIAYVTATSATWSYCSKPASGSENLVGGPRLIALQP